MFNSSSNYFIFNKINATGVVFKIHYWCTRVEYWGFHVFTVKLVWLKSLCINLILRQWIKSLDMYFLTYSNYKKSMNNTWNQPSSVKSSSMLRILMAV